MKPAVVLTRIFLVTALVFGAAVITHASEIADLAAGQSYIHPSRGRVQSSMMLQVGEGTFHNGETLLCSQCHSMHASQQHPHDGQQQPDPWGPFPQNFTPAPKLLKASDPVSLCLTCHDNVAGVPDVIGADVNGLADRSAGYFDTPGDDNPRGHKLGFGLDTSPGFALCMRCHFGGTFETAAVSCIDCHNPHGNQRARNLQWASDPGGEPQFGLFISPAATGMARYETANVGHGTTNDNSLREVSNMCNDCHHVFTGDTYNDPDGDGIHSRHPSYDSEPGSTNNIAQGELKGSTAPAHWDNGTGAGFLSTARLRFVNSPATDFASTQTVDATVNGVFCLSCHKAHGGMRSFALLWDPASGINGEGCDQCHNKTAP